MLSPQLQKQLPAADFELISAMSELTDVGKVVSVDITSVRISRRVDRGLAGLVAVFGVARFASGVHQPLRCEYLLSEDSLPQLIDFTTDFTEAFPVEISMPIAGMPPAETRVDWLLSGEVATVVEAVAPKNRHLVDKDVVAAFLHRLGELVGSKADLATRRAIHSELHHYSVGSRIERVSGNVLDAQGREIPFTITTRFGALESFHFGADELGEFLSNDRIESLIRQRIRMLLTGWLYSEAMDEAVLTHLLDAELQVPTAWEGLMALRDGLHQRMHAQNPLPEDSGINRVWKPDGETHWLVDCQLPGKVAPLALRFTFELDATSLRCTAIEVR